MAIKKNKNSQSIAEQIDNVPEPEFSEIGVGRGKGARRPHLNIPLTEQGEIDFSRMKPEAKEKFSQLVPAVGIPGDSDLKINREFIPVLYDGIAGAIQTVGRYALSWPPELAILMKYTPEQKQKLTEPTAKFLEKVSPAWLVKNQELAALVMAFTSCTKEMVENAIFTYVRTMPTPPPVAKSETEIASNV